MGGLIEIAAGILRSSQQQLEIVSKNVSNASTSGYKRQISFEKLIQDKKMASFQNESNTVYTDFSGGKLIETKNDLDVAIAGKGFFKVKSQNSTLFTRQGLFNLNDRGQVVTVQGYKLQSMDGQDIVLRQPNVEILGNGIILEQGRPVAKIGVFQAKSDSDFDAIGGGYFSISEQRVEGIEQPQIRQGKIEASNVSMSGEMLKMMTLIRQAETGSRLVQVYDSLIGQAISTFGQGT